MERLKEAYRGLNPDSSIARLARDTIRSSEEALNAFAEAAEDAVVNYRLQDGHKNNAPEGEKYSLRGYTEQQKKNWESSKRIVIYDNQEQLLQFISDSIANKTMDKKMHFGAIPAELATRIKSDTGLNVENFNLSLGSYEVRKILKDHGNTAKEAARGQRAIVVDDFRYITHIVLNPAEIKLSGQDYMGKPAIVFSGDHNGRMNVVAVVSDKRLDLFVQTVYTNVKKETLLRRQVNKPLSIRPKRTVVRLPITVYAKVPETSIVFLRIKQKPIVSKNGSAIGRMTRIFASPSGFVPRSKWSGWRRKSNT